MSAPVAVIVNASAGAGCTAEWAEKLTGLFRAAGMEVAVTLAADGAQIVEAAKRAVAAGARLVAAGGGDGTINAVASVLVGTEVALGVLPLGTLNHFAKDLKLPLELEDAVTVIAAGHVAQVDVGEVNQRIFLNNSSIGLYPDIVRDRERQQRRLGRGKWLAFFWATLTMLRAYPFLRVRLSLDGHDIERRTAFVFVGNNDYVLEGFDIGERARLDGGHLSLYTTQRTGRVGLLRLALRALLGRLRQARDFDALRAREITVETHHAQLRVATDGEISPMATPLHYRIRPGALRVRVASA
ncbi:MAG TPA: diacylglycerol kinase family protein [Solimonas sp.]|nr:diacylglycerol kinase family protein [Solimonas sp.]